MANPALSTGTALAQNGPTRRLAPVDTHSVAAGGFERRRPMGGPGSPEVLLGRARAVLSEAAAAGSAGERFCLAHLGALRVAAAVLADRGRPPGSQRRLVSAWTLLERVAPELVDWSLYFAAGAGARAAIEAGALDVVTPRGADDQLRSAQEFLDLVEASFGMLPARLAG